MPPFAEPAASTCSSSTVPKGIDACDSNRRDLLLIEAVLERIAAARLRLERGEYAAKSRLLHPAVELVNALRRGLDAPTGNEIAANLDDLYDYVARQLSRAVLQNRRALLDEAEDLLREIRAAWMILQPSLHAARSAGPMRTVAPEAPME